MLDGARGQQGGKEMDWDCDDWEAWRDTMPGKDVTLHVNGSCNMPTPGYVLSLTPHVPQGINPNDYLLDLSAVAPSNPQTDVVTPTPVNYKETTEFPYETVTILDAETGEPIKAGIPVKVVS
jgi:hypothetical protein